MSLVESDLNGMELAWKAFSLLMKKQLKKMKKLPLFLIILFTAYYNLNAQDQVSITGTNLSIKVQEGYSVDESSATISSEAFAISFIEMAGINFFDQVGDFKDIEAEYAEKGIAVKSMRRGKMSTYDALFLAIESNPPFFQIFFGDSSFCALGNLAVQDSTLTLDEIERDLVLNSIAYINSSITPLEEHANFLIQKEESEWEFVKYTANIFAFEHKSSEDVLMITQLPPATLMFNSKEGLAQQFISKFQEKMPSMEVIEEGGWKTQNLDGYRVLLDVSKEGERGLIYMFVFGSDKSTFVFQGLGEENDEATIKQYDNFLNELALKK